MRQSIIQASLLVAASSVLAAPFQKRQIDESVVVSLKGAQEVDTTFLSVPEGSTLSQGLEGRGTGPFSTVEISVGPDANPALRCQVQDANGIPLAATRGANFDITFSDADKGAWTFDPPVMAATVLCAPGFVGKGSDVNVTLADGMSEDSITTFVNFVQTASLPPSGRMGPFKTFELSVGVNNNPALRCGAKDASGNFLFATRGTNRDTTFSDADKGAWTFEQPDVDVAEIVCDPSFVANNQPLTATY